MQPRTVVVLAHGGVVRLTAVAAAAPAVLDAALLGQAGGGAVADVLFGRGQPLRPARRDGAPAPRGRARLPRVPGRARRTTATASGCSSATAGTTPAAWTWRSPSATACPTPTFAFTDLELTSSDAGVTVRLTVTNTGSRAGREVVQVYAALPGSEVPGRRGRWRRSPT